MVAAFVSKHDGVPATALDELGPLSSLAMTSHDQAFFTADGDVLVPSPLARGPWGSTISGTYIGGLLGRAIERAGGDPDLQPARLTVDLLRPVALADPVRVDTSVEREGRRIRLVDAAMRQNDIVVARASALFLRRGEQPTDPAWTHADRDAAATHAAGRRVRRLHHGTVDLQREFDVDRARVTISASGGTAARSTRGCATSSRSSTAKPSHRSSAPPWPAT